MIGKKLKLAFNSNEKYEKFCISLVAIDKDIQTYIKIKTLSSLATALFSFTVLYFVGVDLAVFWALLLFILNFIPTIGSMVAVFFPLIITLIQFTSILPFVIVAILLILIQTIIGSILEPKFLGKSLNLSPLVIILSLTIWGSIWGVVGMFLCVPIMVITNIILAKFEKTRPIAVMLSATGMVK
jgi:predicted PurR-regulated permease PerM